MHPPFSIDPDLQSRNPMVGAGILFGPGHWLPGRDLARSGSGNSPCTGSGREKNYLFEVEIRTLRSAFHDYPEIEAPYGTTTETIGINDYRRWDDC